MHLDTLPSDHVITILGAPRSGTTWLAKLFDSHPDVLYRHEPDTMLLDQTRRVFEADCTAVEYLDGIRDHFRTMMRNTSLRASGKLPRFRKRYRTGLADISHNVMLHGLRSLERMTRGRYALHNVDVPDMFDASSHSALRVVLKSVSFQIHARALSRALPGTRIIFIVRDPYGQVASMLRGAALGKFERPVDFATLAATRQARRYGLTERHLEEMSAVERYSWHWAIYNEMTYDDIDGLENVRVVRYEALCRDPEGQLRDLMAFAGLDWNAQTADFVVRSTRPSVSDGYYQVYKDPAATLHRWRTQLDAREQERIYDVISGTTAGSLWLASA